MIFLTALGAGAAMYLQDIVATMMVQAEARNRAVLAGLGDCVGYGLQLAVAAVTLHSVFSGSVAGSAAIIGAVTLANFWGTWTGVKLGARFIGRGESD